MKKACRKYKMLGNRLNDNYFYVRKMLCPLNTIDFTTKGMVLNKTSPNCSEQQTVTI